MALTYDQVTAITRKFYMPKFPQLVFDQNLVQKRLAAKGTKPSSGESIQQPVMYQATKGGSYAPYDTFDVSAEDQVTAANFNWKYYEVPITLSRDEILKNKGPEGVKKLMDAKMKLAAMKMSDNLATDMFTLRTTGSDSEEYIQSLENVVDGLSAGSMVKLTGTNGETFGGINKETYTWWAGNSYDGGGNGNGPVYQRLNEAFFSVADGNIQPTLLVMHNNSFGSYMSEQAGQQRYMKQSELDAGFLTAMFNGKTVVADLHVSDDGTTTEESNRVYFLNEDFLDFVVHRDENNRLEPFAKPIDQAVGVAHIMFAGELTCSDPSRQLMLKNFDSLAIVY